ncbi:hypothetical protein [Natrarchaeobius chitinivorans]|uniref:Uncharacterized protein n=1 Tax=Natrarchaeobius chitinivorans TaxID=1679083 RepID=A0A3N6LYU4_NATCH|nr:hypothetical protein [Natrarchaeobius chitinivorans]RQG96033.1 hypothetical protein EA473_07620 [Natrarchaeobius chitinivorans]
MSDCDPTTTGQQAESDQSGRRSLVVAALHIENAAEPDEVVLFTDDIKHCTEWVAASGSNSFVEVREYR